MDNHKRSMRFYCFSPAVMLATFLLEIGMVAYILIYRKMSTTIRLGVILLSCLAVFQLSEYGICESWGLSGDHWARIGFVAITLLPAVGLHLMFSIAKQKSIIIYAAYFGAICWAAIFFFGEVIEDSICSGNYIIFSIPEPYEGSYYLYYNSIMLATIVISFGLAQNQKSKKLRTALRLLGAGYLTFIIPSIAFSLINDRISVDSPLPSVMCGFAVIFALILTIKVLPLSSTRRK
jgi:hypothetical protein